VIWRDITREADILRGSDPNLIRKKEKKAGKEKDKLGINSRKMIGLRLP